MDSTLVMAGTMVLLLAAAAWHDLRSFRIPNAVSLGGALLALLLSLLLPSGHPVASLAGWLLGLFILLPFYALRAMGAGDVKLLAMAGAFAGPAGVLAIGLYTMIAGGVLAVVVALGGGRLLQAMRNLPAVTAAGVSPAPQGAEPAGGVVTSGRLPYGVAILFGGIAWWLLRTGA